MKNRYTWIFLFVLFLYTKPLLAQFELIKDINTTPQVVSGERNGWYTKFAGKVYFVANDSAHGQELWVTDGTSSGTNIVKDINPGGVSGGQQHIGCFNLTTSTTGRLNNELFFNGFDPTRGSALWKTDGTTNGTVLVKDVSPLGPQTSVFQNPMLLYFTPINGKLVFVGDDSIHGKEVWVTDGTTNGTTLLKDINPYSNYAFGGSDPNSFIVYNNKVLFSANDSTHGREIWVTDGTTAGTQLLLDLQTHQGNASTANLSSYPSSFYQLNNELIFIAGGALYKTDGTVSGTVLLSDTLNGFWYPRIVEQDLGLGNLTSHKKYFTEMGGKLYFLGSEANPDTELWVTDGTKQGTKMVKELTVNSIHPAIQGEIAVLRDSLLIFYATDKLLGDPNYDGYELWSSDGTSAGTSLLKNTYTNGINNIPLQLGRYYYEFKGKLYFRARSDNAYFTLWTTDGTTQGTYPLSDTIVSLRSYPIQYNDRMYFRTTYSLWESGGDSVSTKIIKPVGDATPIVTPSFGDGEPFFYSFVEFNDQLIFTCNFGSTGFEPWKLKTAPVQVLSYEKKELDFTIYPNPTNSVITVRTKEQFERLELYDINGRCLYHTKETDLSVSTLSNGLYILKIYTARGIGSSTFQVKK